MDYNTYVSQNMDYGGCMKVLMVVGARVGGNTDALVKQFEKGAKEAGHEVQKEYLFSKKMNGCIGCRRCRSNNDVCVWKDDLVSVNQAILESDVIVFASPIYFYGISAQLKMAMDRTFAIENHVHDKQIYFITSAAAPALDQYLKKLQYAIDTIQGWVDCYRNHVTFMKVIAAWDMFQQPDITKSKAYIDAYEVGKQL